MSHIVVSDEQARVIAESNGHVEIRDRDGRHLGYVASEFTEEDIAIAKKRRDTPGPRYTTEQALERIRALEQK